MPRPTSAREGSDCALPTEEERHPSAATEARYNAGVVDSGTVTAGEMFEGTPGEARERRNLLGPAGW